MEVVLEDNGLRGHDLHKCGNQGCDFSAQNVSDFKDHLVGKFKLINRVGSMFTIAYSLYLVYWDRALFSWYFHEHTKCLFETRLKYAFVIFNNQFADILYFLVCENVSDSLYYNCAHCDKEFKHPPTLIDHLKSHAVKRFHCGLCDYKSPVLHWMKAHIKLHKVSNLKLVQILPNKNNADEDCFIVVPKVSIDVQF